MVDDTDLDRKKSTAILSGDEKTSSSAAEAYLAELTDPIFQTLTGVESVEMGDFPTNGAISRCLKVAGC
jgi:hypothetical protein